MTSPQQGYTQINTNIFYNGGDSNFKITTDKVAYVAPVLGRRGENLGIMTDGRIAWIGDLQFLNPWRREAEWPISRESSPSYAPPHDWVLVLDGLTIDATQEVTRQPNSKIYSALDPSTPPPQESTYREINLSIAKQQIREQLRLPIGEALPLDAVLQSANEVALQAQSPAVNTPAPPQSSAIRDALG